MNKVEEMIKNKNNFIKEFNREKEKIPKDCKEEIKALEKNLIESIKKRLEEIANFQTDSENSIHAFFEKKKDSYFFTMLICCAKREFIEIKEPREIIISYSNKYGITMEDKNKAINYFFREKEKKGEKEEIICKCGEETYKKVWYLKIDTKKLNS